MNYIKTKKTSSGEEVKLYYEDLGDGQPVVFIHGWPLSQEMWEYQVTELVSRGLRCITYDRRGFGKSSRPIGGYDYDTLAGDLKAVLDELDLDNVILVGFSMGGGEAVRYISRYGSERVAKLVLIGSVTPYLLKTTGNENAVDITVFEEMLANIKKDRIGFLDNFGKDFFGVNMLNHPLSTPLLEYYRMLASFASPIATQECAKAFAQTDFREDVVSVKVPTLIIHGDADKIVPMEVSSNRTAQLITDNHYIVYDDAPHGLFYTHKDQLNRDLWSFINDEILVEEIHAPDSVVLPSNYPI